MPLTIQRILVCHEGYGRADLVHVRDVYTCSRGCTCTCCAEMQHVNTNQQLEIEMSRMRNDGVVGLLQDDMPLECMIIEHYDVFLALLP